MPSINDEVVMARLEAKLDTLTQQLAEIKQALQDQRDSAQQMALWRERVEARLIAGAEKMNAIASDLVAHKVKHDADAAALDKRLEGYIPKNLVAAWLAGAACAGGAVGAFAAKLLGFWKP